MPSSHGPPDLAVVSDVLPPDVLALLGASAEATRLRGVQRLRDDDGAAPLAVRVRALVEMLADPGAYVPNASCAALQTLGDDGVPALLPALTDVRVAVRIGAMWALARPIGERNVPDVRSAVLEAPVRDASRDVRQAAAAVLGRCLGDAEDAAAAGALVELTADPDPRVRLESLRSLIRAAARLAHGTAASDAIRDGLGDPRSEVRRVVAGELTALDPARARTLVDGPRIAECIGDEPQPHLRDALRGLAERIES